MSRDTKAEAAAIRAILWSDWDPIGCGVAEDEYDEYIWPIYKLLIEDAARAALEAYLRRVTEDLQIAVIEERQARAIDKLLALKIAPGPSA